MKKLINFIVFQFIWFLCIYGASSDNELPAVVLGATGVAFNLFLGGHCKRDLSLLAKGVLLGICLDTLLIQLDLISFNSHYWHVISPVWMWVIWAGFLGTVNHSLSWLNNQLALAAILGAVMGPISYWSGVSLGAGRFVHLEQSLLAISIMWLLATPLIMKMSQNDT